SVNPVLDLASRHPQLRSQLLSEPRKILRVSSNGGEKLHLVGIQPRPPLTQHPRSGHHIPSTIHNHKSNAHMYEIHHTIVGRLLEVSSRRPARPATRTAQHSSHKARTTSPIPVSVLVIVKRRLRLRNQLRRSVGVRNL